MKEANLKLAQEDINAALEAVEDIEKFINDESVEKDVLKEKFSSESIDREYIVDFYNLEILDMDKIEFIKEWGNKNTKKLLVDYILN